MTFGVMMSESAFDKENIDAALLITATRCYDALIVLLDILDPDKAKTLVTAHENGLLLAPPPSFREEE